ncbi:NADH-quinone oxidoreductase subunit J, partial [Gemmatimonas sp.]|uniref:NADH-quinone oxidoreductase subunit J n=1 Tax=Gemmatimonas sp. TaxID=1962908 RepID=UPI0037C19175
RTIETVALVLFGALALVAAASMLFMREPMRVALALITSMSSLGAVYGLMGVHFIAAFQVLIYVGAVMVFMVYVIMLLEVKEAPGSKRFSSYVVPGVVVGVLLMAALGAGMLRGPMSSGMLPGEGSGTFSLVEFSSAFLTRYWLVFELTTVFLVGAIVAALAVVNVSRRKQEGA